MYHKDNQQEGFSVVGLLLILVIIGLLGFVGWFVWHSRQASNATFKNTNSVAESTPAKPQTQTSSKYLTIKEWGVKIPLSSADAGVYYKIDTDIQQSATNPTNLTVYATEVDNLVGPAGVSCKGEYVAYLLRLPQNDPQWQPSVHIYDGNVSPQFVGRIVVGNYRYAIDTQKQYGPPCLETSKTSDYTDDPVTTQKLDNVVRAFEGDFENIVAS